MQIEVAGAGLGGLTFALAAERLGLPVALRDERPALGGGAAITLWPRALAVLDAIGLSDVVRELGEPASAATLRRSDGTLLRRVAAHDVEQAVGGPVRVFDRGDLQQALADRVQGPLRWGEPLAPDTAVDADLLVGADGFRSVVARRLDPTIDERPTGYVAFRGVVTGEVDGDHHGVVWGRGLEAGIAPMRGGRTYWFATFPEAEASREGLLDALRDWAGPLPELVRSTPQHSMGIVPVTARTMPNRWHDSRSVVIGDAAHAMLPALGQGGGHAIVDAGLLASLLADAPGEATARFEAARRRDIARAMRRSDLAWRAAHATGPVASALAWGARLTPASATGRVLRRFAS